MDGRKPHGLDSLPIELVLRTFHQLSGVSLSEHIRTHASTFTPLTLLSKRYFPLARQLMVRRVSLETRVQLERFVLMIGSERWRPWPIECLALWIDGSDERRMEEESRGAWSIKDDWDELREAFARPVALDFARLVETIARSVGSEVAAVCLQVRANHLPHIVVPAMRALTAGKHAYVSVEPVEGQDDPEVAAEAFRALVHLFGGVKLLEVEDIDFMDPEDEDYRTDGRTDLFQNVRFLRLSWDDCGLARAIAEQTPRLHSLTLNTTELARLGPAWSCQPESSRFAAQVRTLNVDSIDGVGGMCASDFRHFTSLQTLDVRWMNEDGLDIAELPPSLKHIRIAVTVVSTDVFWKTSRRTIECIDLRQIVIASVDTAEGAIGWYDDLGRVDARDVRAACQARGVDLVVGNEGAEVEQVAWGLF